MAPIKATGRKSPRKKKTPPKNGAIKGQASIRQFFAVTKKPEAVDDERENAAEAVFGTKLPSKQTPEKAGSCAPPFGTLPDVNADVDVVAATPEARPVAKRGAKVKLDQGRGAGIRNNRAASGNPAPTWMNRFSPTSGRGAVTEDAGPVKKFPLSPAVAFNKRPKPSPSPSPKKPSSFGQLKLVPFCSPELKKMKTKKDREITDAVSPVTTFTDDIERALLESLAEDALPIVAPSPPALKVPAVRNLDFSASSERREAPNASDPPQSLPNLRFRHEVTEVSEFGTSKLLVLKKASPSSSSSSSGVTRCRLEGLWSRTEVEPGDVVNVLHAEPVSGDGDADVRVTNARGLVVVNPDFLVSGTAVVAGVFCRRKAVLAQTIRGTDSGSKEMIVGVLLHRIFQETLKSGRVEERFLEDLVRSELADPSVLADLYALGVSEADMATELLAVMPAVVDWLRRYYGSVLLARAPPPTTTSAARKSINSRYPQWNGRVTEIVDVEENIWSPRFGLKGKIDLSVKVRCGGSAVDDVLPLELKTGRPSFAAEHTGQVILYSMMMDDRRPNKMAAASNDPGGLLVYLRDGSTAAVRAGDPERRDLVMLRNEMARSYGRKLARGVARPVEAGGDGDELDGYRLPRLPDPIVHARACERCPYILACAAYQRVVECRTYSEGHPMSILVPAALAHLSHAHLAYYRRWLLLLSLETEDSVSQSSRVDSQCAAKDIWTLSGPEREKRGDCLADMALKPGCVVDVQGPRRCVHVFVRASGCHGDGSGNVGSGNSMSLRCAGLNVDDWVVVSSADGVFVALAAGGVERICVDEIAIALDRDLTSTFNGPSKKVYRIDRVTNAGDTTSAICRGYLLQLMSDTPECQELRDIIIDRVSGTKADKFSKSACLASKDVIRALNERQQRAVLHVLMCNKYALVRGVPGSGKTRLVVALIRVLARRMGMSVLLVGYTHSAVDNVLAKLLADHPDEFDAGNTIRLGNPARVHADVLRVADGNVVAGARSVQQLEDIYASKTVVATTCLSMAHPMFARGRRFDVCIVDEAAQALQPAAVGPLLFARKFVLVGDPNQLPPVVVSEAAGRMGMSESLFSRLDDDSARVTVELSIQYRMNSEIMRLANELTYGGRLRCADEGVASATLDYRDDDEREKDSSNCRAVPTWMREALSRELADSVKFICTDSAVECTESRDVHGRIVNQAEAQITLKLVEVLLRFGVKARDVGVITPYRAQVNLLRRLLRDRTGAAGGASVGDTCRTEDVEVNTVDQYQGRDKSVILFSCVRSAPGGGYKDILLDERRLNVAVTRAKHKLLLLGNREALSTYKPFRDLMDVLRPDQFLDLPADGRC